MFDWLEKLIDTVVFNWLRISHHSRPGASLHFFLYDTAKIFMLLLIIIFIITFIRTFFSPERTRRILAEKKGRRLTGHILAALLGIVTPFCSCSAVPLFIGFVEAGIPLGVTFSYLIAAPMVNEVALGMLYGLFGLKIALIYIGSGVLIAIASGLVIGRLGLEKHVEAHVFQTRLGAAQESEKPDFRTRLKEAWQTTWEIFKKIHLYVIGGIAIGALMHGWIPAGALAGVAGRGNPFAVLMAVIIGVPLYSNAAGVIPLVSELTRAGVAMGTALAFMMSVTALSVPEMVLLRRVLKPRLLAIFIAIVAVGIIFTGYLFNFFL